MIESRDLQRVATGQNLTLLLLCDLFLHKDTVLVPLHLEGVVESALPLVELLHLLPGGIPLLNKLRNLG